MTIPRRDPSSPLMSTGFDPPVGVPPQVQGYSVVRELGRGGSSRVWLVQPDGGGSPVALKVPDHAVDVTVSELDHELRAIGELKHDHLVGPRGVVETDQGPGLLSDYQPGGSLGSLVRAVGPLPLGQVVTSLVPIAQALEVLHGRGVVHADVSPGNILYSVEGRPGLADLGCSRLLGGASRRGGTPGFQAPEVQASTLPGTAADVYSLAAVGWYALTGRAPVMTHARAPLTLTLPEIPSSVVALLEAGLSMDPDLRPTAAQFATACFDWTTPEPVDLSGAAHPSVAMELPTRRPHPGEDLVRRRRPRFPRPVILAGCGAAAAAMTVAVALHVNQPGAAENVDHPAAVAAAPSAAPVTAGPLASVQPSSSPSPMTSGPSTPPMEQERAASEVSEAVRAIGPARTLALTEQTPEQVLAYAQKGSPAQEQDEALIAELADRGLRYQDLTLTVEVIGDEPTPSPETTTARVPVELRISPHTTRDADTGLPVAEQASAASERVELDLVRTGQGWRLQQILPPRS